MRQRQIHGGWWAAATALAACAAPHTLCPEGTGVTRLIYSGGGELEWCHRDDGVRQGPDARFYESGARMVEGGYRDGVQEGIWRYYLDQGTVWREDRWDDGALVARRIDPRVARPGSAAGDVMRPTSSMIVKLASADPLLGRSARARPGTGFAVWYANGRPRVAGRYDGDGLRTGTWRFWSEDGRLAREADYDAGVRHRAFREWHPNGAPKTDGFYLEGEPDGRWRTWDPAGRLIGVEDVQRGIVAP